MDCTTGLQIDDYGCKIYICNDESNLRAIYLSTHGNKDTWEDYTEKEDYQDIWSGDNYVDTWYVDGYNDHVSDDLNYLKRDMDDGLMQWTIMVHTK